MFYCFPASAEDEIKGTIASIDRAIAESEAQIARSLATIEQESRDIAQAKVLRDEYIALIGSSREPLIDTSTYDEPHRVSCARCGQDIGLYRPGTGQSLLTEHLPSCPHRVSPRD